MTGIPEKLAAIFQVEHAEHLRHIRSILGLLENVPDVHASGDLEEAFRRAHSLKGAARAVDLTPIEGLAQGLETLFSRVRRGALPLDTKAVRVIHQVLDSSEDCLAEFRQNRTPAPPAAALRAMELLMNGGEPEFIPPARPQPAEEPPAPVAVAAAVPRTEMVRVDGGDLDRLVRSTGQILAESQSHAIVTAELIALQNKVKEMQAECIQFRKTSIASLRRLTRSPEFASVAKHLEVVEQRVNSLASQARRTRLLQESKAWALKGSAERLQRDVWSARIAPVEELFEGFGKMVRDLARDERKQIEFRLNGSGVKADRLVLQALKDPLMHILRNAISHGFESPAERTAKGKPAAGTLTVNAQSQRGRLVIEVDDDGRGVDFDRVAKVAIEQGVLSEETAGGSRQDLIRTLFRPGFSTSPSVNDLSGRGMGLSVVHESVRRLQGDVDFQQKSGPGACVLLSVPLSVSVVHLLMVSCQGQVYGIPSHGIERLYRIQVNQVETVEGRPVVNLSGRRVPLFGLGNLLGTPRSNNGTGDGVPGRIIPVLLLRSGTRTAAVWVDSLLAEREALIQELGMPLPPNGNVSGGLLLRDGVVSVVLNPAGLVDTSTRSAEPAMKIAQPPAKVAAATILVVDDSITTRSLEKSILEAHGYSVRVAVDGLEALQMLRASPSELVIADIEMPRMDGFGLLAAIKSDEHLRRTPVIIVSSLDSPEVLQRGLDLGADAHVVKGRFDQFELLEAVRRFL